MAYHQAKQRDVAISHDTMSSLWKYTKIVYIKLFKYVLLQKDPVLLTLIKEEEHCIMLTQIKTLSAKVGCTVPTLFSHQILGP